MAQTFESSVIERMDPTSQTINQKAINMFTDGDVITKVWMLLDIVHKASSAGPAYTKWADTARAELDNTYTTYNTPEPTPEPELPLTPEDPTNG